MAVNIDVEKCTGCGACVEICPTEALSPYNDDKTVIDKNACIDCGVCEDECPVEALNL